MPSFVIRRVGDLRRETIYLEPGVLYLQADGTYVEPSEPLVANRVERLVNVTTAGRTHPVWVLVGFEVIGEVLAIDPAPKKRRWRRIFWWRDRPSDVPALPPATTRSRT